MGSYLKFFIGCFFALSLQGVAADEEFSQYNGKYRLAWEIELPPPQLAHIIDYFDVSQALSHSLTFSPFTLDNYILQEGALESLPMKMRQELSQGLNLSHLSLADSQKNVTTPGGLVISAAVQRQLDWQTLKNRWLEIPVEKRISLIHPDLLSREEKAVLAYQLAVNRNTTETMKKMPLKLNLPSGVGRLLRKLLWEKDRQAVEFKMKGTTTAPLEYLRDLNLFARMTQTSRGFNDLNSPPEGGVSYHLHLSTVDGREISPFLDAYNRLLLCRFAHEDRAESLSESKLNGYNSIFNRGLVRLLEPNHAEIRTHTQNPDQELKEVLELLSLPEEEANQRMVAEMKSLLNEKTLAELGKYFPKALVEIANEIPTLQFHPEVKKSREKLRALPLKLTSVLETLYYSHAGFLSGLTNPEKSQKTTLLLQKEIASHLTVETLNELHKTAEENTRTKGALLYAIDLINMIDVSPRNSALPAHLMPEALIPLLVTAVQKKESEKAAALILKLSSESPDAMKSMIDLFRLGEPTFLREFYAQLGGHTDWLARMKEEILNGLHSTDPEIRRRHLLAISLFALPDKLLEDAYEKAFLAASTEVQLQALKNIKNGLGLKPGLQPNWNVYIDPHLHERAAIALKSTDPLVTAEALRVLESAHGCKALRHLRP